MRSTALILPFTYFSPITASSFENQTVTTKRVAKITESTNLMPAESKKLLLKTLTEDILLTFHNYRIEKGYFKN